jgi:hypothetical protein
MLTYADSVFAVDSMGEDGCVASARCCYVVLLRDECCKGSECISSLVENLKVLTEVRLKVRKLVAARVISVSVCLCLPVCVCVYTSQEKLVSTVLSGDLVSRVCSVRLFDQRVPACANLLQLVKHVNS